MITQAKRLVWLVSLALYVNAFGADLVARLDRTQVAEGDPVVLTLSVSGGANGAPDLTPLRQDFDLLNRSQSTHMRFVNGRSSSGTEWHLTLMPKRTGKIEIPAITFGDTSSKPLTLDVLPAAQAAKQGMPRPVMIEVDAEPRQPYVQQQVIYTVRLLFEAPLRDVNLSEPRASNALVRPLGEGRRYETYRNGKQYQVVERQYAVLPQRSGTLEIGGPLLNARVVQPGQQPRGRSLRDRFFGNDPFAALGRDPFAGLNSVFGQTRPLQIKGPGMSLDVQPQPAGTPSPWLPAQSLTLNETWSPAPDAFRVGEPITRTIVITAQGLSAEQLPDPDIAVPAGIKVYPENPTLQTRPDQDTLVAQKVIRAALIPSRAGMLTLPEISVAWWDVDAGKEAVARLPSRSIDVRPGAAGSGGTSSTPGLADMTGQPGHQAPQPSGRDEARNDGVPTAAGGWPYWPWLAALLGAALLAAIVALWWRSRKPGPETPAGRADRPATPAARPDPTRALVKVERAFHADDAKSARRALLAWAEERWPQDPPRRLDVVAQRLGPGTAGILQGLDKALYADSASARRWDGKTTWQQLKPRLKSVDDAKSNNRENNSLPPLYASSR